MLSITVFKSFSCFRHPASDLRYDLLFLASDILLLTSIYRRCGRLGNIRPPHRIGGRRGNLGQDLLAAKDSLAFQKLNPQGRVDPLGTGLRTGARHVAARQPMSNVDLSQEMSNMIIAQSGFDANSKVITTDDQLMQTLVNMIQG